MQFYSIVAKIFVYEVEKQIVGFIIFREEYCNTGKSIIVEELVVNGKFQRIGVGKKIMSFLETYCKVRKINSIWLITNKKAGAFNFYKKVGYVQEKDVVYFSKRLK